VTSIDWSNSGFLQMYAYSFAAATFITVILWLIAVAKRAIQGVHPVQALGEAIGYLLAAVMTSAFAPLAISLITSLFDALATAMLASQLSNIGALATQLSAALTVIAVIPGGDVVSLTIAVALLMAVIGVWLELVVRNALILAGLIFGPIVFSGLVDKDLWGHSKKWLGAMIGIIASKYVTFTTLALAVAVIEGNQTAGGFSITQAFGTLFTGFALLILALYLPFKIAMFVPILGDQLAETFHARQGVQGAVKEAHGKAKDTYSEISSRMGGDSGGGAEAAAGAAPAVGAAVKGAQMVKDQGKGAAQRGLNGATQNTDSSPQESNQGPPSPTGQSNDGGGQPPMGPPPPPPTTLSDSAEGAPGGGSSPPGAGAGPPAPPGTGGSAPPPAAPPPSSPWSDGSPVEEPPPDSFE